MTLSRLRAIEWHDLPIESLTLNAQGFALVVTPFHEETQSYSVVTLHISEAATVNLNISGPLSSRDFSAIEVSSFQYSLNDTNRLSGVIEILPGSAGFWSIAFENANWEVAHA
ncbi:hypothetical protein GCM10025771_00600 [Niveibacterium umoris]|uniref:Uncharacterized protein n=1 Tax=Niveibacterium umoris TaxID=1193620 RepID=A0A840BW15_9RHOO|nr:hypothetical protein [Niveibacterium umoris]MBB4014986.1 hypothetical protein [Niveibacterium umoris]